MPPFSGLSLEEEGQLEGTLAPGLWSVACEHRGKGCRARATGKRVMVTGAAGAQPSVATRTRSGARRTH